ncbi:hypothetical protein PHMEG_00017871 [Phytophthora megakarya]|uniref:Uncharacterized protein n=1 Tax=Phytophthora megakarya TaxID=4795 RepID=A0A225VWR9_9STRA|nr:hypothetical protein PHMEG_00017871 [Phytophthora megakarya]
MEEVSLLLNGGANIAMRDKNETTALHCAAYNGHTKVVLQLLDANADVSAEDKHGNTALHDAAQKGHMEVVSLLLKRGAKLPARGLNGMVLLGAQGGHTELVSHLLDRGADVNTADNNGMTALLCAAQGGHTEIVSCLLDRGADVHASDNNGMTALLCGAQGGHTEMVLHLLERGADVEASDNNGMTALLCGAQGGHTEMVLRLLERGANVLATNDGGITALSIASTAIPIAVVGAAAEKVLAVSKSKLDRAITVKSILDSANLCPGEEKSSQELGSLEERAAFLKELLAQHEPPLLDQYSISKVCGLHRAVSKDGCYIWVTEVELSQLENYQRDDPKPAPLQSILLQIVDATGTWNGRRFIRIYTYCEWKLLYESECIQEGATMNTVCTASDMIWEPKAVNVTESVKSIEKLRACTLHVFVKQARRVRKDKVIAEGKRKLNDLMGADCSTTQIIDVPINVAETTSLSRTVKCQISIKFAPMVGFTSTA